MGSPCLISLEGVKSFSGLTIDEDLDRTIGEVGNDKLTQHFRELEILKSILDLGPFNPIKNIFQINFHGYVAYLTSHFEKVRDHFLNNYGMIRSSSVS